MQKSENRKGGKMLINDLTEEELDKLKQEGYKVYILSNVSFNKVPYLVNILYKIQQDSKVWCPVLKDKKGNETPIFPGYVFIFLKEFSSELITELGNYNSYWNFLNSNINYTRTLGINPGKYNFKKTIKSEPNPINYNELRETLGAVNKFTENTPITKFLINDKVKITEGTFLGFMGTVVGLGKEEQLKIEIVVFSRPIVVEFNVNDLELL